MAWQHILYKHVVMSCKLYKLMYSTATKLRTGQSEFRIPLGAKDFCLLSHVQTGNTAHPVHIEWVVWYSPGGKAVRA
jgi:hypothetical protein